MLCPICNKVDASLEVVGSFDGRPVKGYVCPDCYGKAVSLDARGFYYYFVTLPKTACPVCGRTYGQFSENLLLGCPHCYKAFEKQLKPLIGRIQSK